MKNLVLLLALAASEIALAQVPPKLAAQRPVPPDPHKSWVYIPPLEPGAPGTWKPYVLPLNAPIGTPTPNPLFPRAEAEATLMKAQTAAIKALAQRVEALEEKLRAIDATRGATK